MIVTCLAVIMATLVVWVLAVRQKRLRDAKSQCQYQNKAHIDTPLIAHAITQKVPISLMMSTLSLPLAPDGATDYLVPNQSLKAISDTLTYRKNGAPGRIRTCDPQIRNLVLYPAELRAQPFAHDACSL